jgi:hypothetical protein
MARAMTITGKALLHSPLYPDSHGDTPGHDNGL